MEKTELRASLALAGIFALRMLGLFLILPVFSMHAKGLPGGDQALLSGHETFATQHHGLAFGLVVRGGDLLCKFVPF